VGRRVVVSFGGAAVVAGLVWFLGGGFDAAARGTADDAFARAGGGGTLEDTIGGIFAAATGAAIATRTIFHERCAVPWLAAVADIVVVDVSQPTENLIWEVAAIRSGVAARCVLVGAYDHIAVFAYPDRLAAGSVNARLAQLLQGVQIVAYEPRKPGLKRFGRAARRVPGAAHLTHSTSMPTQGRQRLDDV
jgi:hypothetical protein